MVTKFQLMRSFFEGDHVTFQATNPNTNTLTVMTGRVLAIKLESGNENSRSVNQFLLTFYDATLGLIKSVYVKTID